MRWSYLYNWNYYTAKTLFILRQTLDLKVMIHYPDNVDILMA